MLVAVTSSLNGNDRVLGDASQYWSYIGVQVAIQIEGKR
jgi:hypothetical protein